MWDTNLQTPLFLVFWTKLVLAIDSPLHAVADICLQRAVSAGDAMNDVLDRLMGFEEYQEGFLIPHAVLWNDLFREAVEIAGGPDKVRDLLVGFWALPYLDEDGFSDLEPETGVIIRPAGEVADLEGELADSLEENTEGGVPIVHITHFGKIYCDLATHLDLEVVDGPHHRLAGAWVEGIAAFETRD